MLKLLRGAAAAQEPEAQEDNKPGSVVEEGGGRATPAVDMDAGGAQ